MTIEELKAMIQAASKKAGEDNTDHHRAAMVEHKAANLSAAVSYEGQAQYYHGYLRALRDVAAWLEKVEK